MSADRTGTPVDPALAELLERPGPVTILLHGFKFCPLHEPSAGDPALRDPHRLVYAAEPEVRCGRMVSWPGMLERNGPVIGVGWPAMHRGRGTWGAIAGFAEVYERAGAVARQVARLMDRIAALDPHRRIDLVGHSLGGRVALAALPHLMRAEPRRVLLWGAAERQTVADAAVAEAPARTEIVSVTARSNARYDAMFECFAPGAGRSMGRGLDRPGLATLQLDDPVTEASLSVRGLPLDAWPQRHCHWSFYRRGGTGALYADLLDRPEFWSLERIRDLAIADESDAQSGLWQSVAAFFPMQGPRRA
ncbi:alpha/beta fold hydrolase [Pontivivens ytuae]|uniref:Alpha/beta fold hydrolase n=1 Tax=Pontivivens ytuae TaxID=2789856 RepID=A0A7S9LQ98_9RHOB|nr:alpha/beta fold hydrolase [Pontivivens ytuae]QPH52990.1 alpha/beta fold hydrolase [Pontivivens ytuae]